MLLEYLEKCCDNLDHVFGDVFGNPVNMINYTLAFSKYIASFPGFLVSSPNLISQHSDFKNRHIQLSSLLAKNYLHQDHQHRGRCRRRNHERWYSTWLSTYSISNTIAILSIYFYHIIYKFYFYV